MLITLSRRTTICQSVAEVQLTVVAPLGAVSHRQIITIKQNFAASLAEWSAYLTNNQEVTCSIPDTSTILNVD